MKKIFFLAFVFISLNSYAQNETNFIVRSKDNRAMEVLGYFSGIELTLNAISETYPDLIPEVNKIFYLYQSNFEKSKKNAVEYLKNQHNSENFNIKIDAYVSELKEQIDTNILFSLKQDSEKHLTEIEKKLRGNIQSPILENILSFQYQDIPHKEIMSGFTNTFSTKGHSKSKNSDWSINVPKSWIAKEGGDPNIIQKFISECGNGLNGISLITQDLPFENFSKAQEKDVDIYFENEFFTENNLKEIMIPKNSTFISYQKMRIANCPGGLIVYDIIQERLGLKIKMRFYEFVFRYGKYIHLLIGDIATFDINKDLKDEENKYFPLFRIVANSVKIIEKKDNIIYLEGNNYSKKIDVNIGNKNYKFLLDTGAEISLMKKSMINELIANKTISLKNFIGKDHVVVANGKSHEVEIWKIPIVKIGSRTLQNIYFSVMNDNNITPLLGMNILSKLDIWKMDLDNNMIYLK